MIRLDLPHARVVRLHVYKADVVILTPETAGTVGVGLLVGLSMDDARSTPQGSLYHVDVFHLLP